MEHVNFRPWVGKNYSTSGFLGKRILVLGESHYCSEVSQTGSCFPICSKTNMNDNCYALTRNGLHDFIYNYSGKGDRHYEQTFLCFERAIFGKKLSQQEREDFWESIIFYNYIQFAQEGTRRPINPEYWQESELAFKEIIDLYMPNNIIVWGARLFDGLPNWDGTLSKLRTSENFYTDVRIYTINGKIIPALKVLHPSTGIGKNWGFWHDVYIKFFENY